MNGVRIVFALLAIWTVWMLYVLGAKLLIILAPPVAFFGILFAVFWFGSWRLSRTRKPVEEWDAHDKAVQLIGKHGLVLVHNDPLKIAKGRWAYKIIKLSDEPQQDDYVNYHDWIDACTEQGQTLWRTFDDDVNVVYQWLLEYDKKEIESGNEKQTE